MQKSIYPKNVSFNILILFLLFNCIKSNAYGSGFSIFTHGAKELGMLASTIAHTEGPASNFYNPALMTELPDVQLELGTTLIFPTVNYTSHVSGGRNAETESQMFYPPTFFYSQPINSDFNLGLGIYSPFGLGTEWPKDWDGRYITTNSELQTFNVNPNIAYKVLDQEKFKLGISGGAFLMYGDAVLESNIPLPSLPDAAQKYDADGVGWGFNLGSYAKIGQNWLLGLSYRSAVDLDLDGDIRFRMPAAPQPMASLLAANFPNTTGDVTLNLPPQLFWGIAYQFDNGFLVEVGGKWEGWSSYESLELNTAQAINGTNTIITPKEWDDTLGFNIGLKYSPTETWAVSMGYIFEETPVPNHTFEPSIPSNDKNIVSIGFQKGFLADFTLSAAYMYEFYDDRIKNNAIGGEFGSTANGLYEQSSHLIAISLTLRIR